MALACAGLFGSQAQAQAPKKCRDDGKYCTRPSDCCSGLCAKWSKSVGTQTTGGACIPRKPLPCRPANRRCSNDDQCCTKSCGKDGKCAVCAEENIACAANENCCSGRCNRGICAAGCNERLNQVQNGGSCFCKPGFVNTNPFPNPPDNLFCVPACGLSGFQCKKDSDCCDSPYYSCKRGQCQASDDCTLGANKIPGKGQCLCPVGFIDVDTDFDAAFCVPNCAFPGSFCQGQSPPCCGVPGSNVPGECKEFQCKLRPADKSGPQAFKISAPAGELKPIKVLI